MSPSGDAKRWWNSLRGEEVVRLSEVSAACIGSRLELYKTTAVMGSSSPIEPEVQISRNICTFKVSMFGGA